jgi:hypothetical protein
MTEKELLAQLNNLKNVKPENTWKKENRDILLSQISGGEYFSAPVQTAESQKNNFFNLIKNYFAQPSFVATAVVVLLIAGGTGSLYAARGTKPGDSLYIAKIISEKTQLAITFGEEERAKLGIEFAGNRAEEINQVLEGVDNEKEKMEKVGKLTLSLKKEISGVRARLKKISAENKNSDENNNVTPEEDAPMFSANLGKDDKGVQIYDGKKASEENSDNNNEANNQQLNNTTATTSIPANNSNATDVNNNLAETLGEAGQLLKEKNYSSTLNKLEEAETAADQIDNGGEEDTNAPDIGTATSTEVN